MIEKEWDEAAAWINLKWDRQPLDPVVAKAWLKDLERFDYGDVLAAINRLVAERAFRPQLPDLLAATRAAQKSRPAPLALPEPKPSKYGEVARQVIGQYRDLLLTPTRLLGKESAERKTAVLAMFEKHRQWFDQGRVASDQMREELEATMVSSLPVDATRPATETTRDRKRGERYSDELKGRYLQAVAEKEAAERGKSV